MLYLVDDPLAAEVRCALDVNARHGGKTGIELAANRQFFLIPVVSKEKAARPSSGLCVISRRVFGVDFMLPVCRICVLCRALRIGQ